jgi:23S rRNA (uracil1939-C5)-methyltransferase
MTTTADGTPTRLSLTLDSLAPTGEAIGRADGMVIFVPFGLPGETVEVEITFRRRSFARGRLLTVITAAPERVAPACPHFTICGGCDLQHMPYPAQLAFKTGAVREQLIRLGKFAKPDVRPCLPSPRPLAYRNNIQFIVSDKGGFGYRAEGSHQVVAVDTCPITAPEVLEAARQAVATGPKAGTGLDARAGLTGGGRSAILRRVPVAENNPQAVLDEPLSESIGDFEYRFAADSFFQVNPFAAEVLVAEAMAAADPQPGQRALDLYCGVGLFTLPLARRAGQALGVEVNSDAVDFARYNAMRGGLTEHAAFVRASALAGLKLEAVRAQRWDILLVDPPRAGLERPVLDAMLALEPQRVVYVSCDPATLARDAALLEAGGYALAYAQPVDVFPQTRHVEVVARFDRSGS